MKMISKYIGLLCSIGFLIAQNVYAQTNHSIIDHTPEDSVYVWEGKLGKNIPVLLKYQKVGNITVGSVIYLNTKARQPIPVIGHRHYDDGRFVINEYANDGKITGEWVLTRKGDSLTGEWYKPYSSTEFPIRLCKKDTSIPAPSIAGIPSQIAGTYAYASGQKGAQGEWTIKRTGKDSISIQAFSVTSAPSRNIADISEPVTVPIADNQFTYAVSSGSDCKIVMQGRFYKNFLVVTYTNKNPCWYYFGHNATLQGVFYKIER